MFPPGLYPNLMVGTTYLHGKLENNFGINHTTLQIEERDMEDDLPHSAYIKKVRCFKHRMPKTTDLNPQSG